LVKQVPPVESLSLGPDGRLERDGDDLEMNAYCRRAVSKATELARATGGTCTVFTLGPPAAEEVLREAVAWGADVGVHLCDPAFAGSDTLATARSLAAAIRMEGPFDLVLVGRNSIDGDTGQVGPEVAELAGLPFCGGARRLEVSGSCLRLQLEHDDGWEETEVQMPALVSVAERLCDPCKVDPAGRRLVPAERLRRLSAAELGSGPWGAAGSATRVGAVRLMGHTRAARVLSGDLMEQVNEAVSLLRARGALTPSTRSGSPAAVAGAVAATPGGAAPRIGGPVEPTAHLPSAELPRSSRTPSRNGLGEGGSPAVVVVVEEGRSQMAAELLGAATHLASLVGGEVVALQPDGCDQPAASARLESVESLGALGADEVVVLVGASAAEDVARGVVAWAADHRPWAVLAPSTAFGREVAGRAAAALGAGLVGDAIEVDVVGGRLVAAKPAFSGALVADITCTSPVQMVTVRPGVLPVTLPRHHEARLSYHKVLAGSRVRTLSRSRDDDVEVLARATVVIGIGTGVSPDEYPSLSTLASILGAELAVTRKVTDKGWAPRSRQVGVTGRSIAPRLYVALGLSGKSNHMVGVRAAGTVLAVNADRAAPVFAQADIGIVGDWHDILPLLEEALRTSLRPGGCQ